MQFVGVTLCSARQYVPFFSEIFGKFATSQRADVGIGPYKRAGRISVSFA